MKISSLRSPEEGGPVDHQVRSTGIPARARLCRPDPGEDAILGCPFSSTAQAARRIGIRIGTPGWVEVLVDVGQGSATVVCSSRGTV
jgi:hypothetical protein